MGEGSALIDLEKDTAPRRLVYCVGGGRGGVKERGTWDICHPT